MTSKNIMPKACPGADGLSCVGGWLYSSIGMMTFPANKKCPTCNKEQDDGPNGTDDVASVARRLEG